VAAQVALLSVFEHFSQCKLSARNFLAPLPPWAHELDGSRKVVLVTQGTLANHKFGLLIAPTLAALAWSAGKPQPGDVLSVPDAKVRRARFLRWRSPCSK
jgi:hypothetical protein